VQLDHRAGLGGGKDGVVVVVGTLLKKNELKGKEQWEKAKSYGPGSNIALNSGPNVEP
jgi:hypothetical protein